MFDRGYWKGFAANLGLMFAGFAVTIVLIFISVSLGLSHTTSEVLAGFALLPMFGAMAVAQFRIFRDAARRPAAIRYRRLPLAQRLAPITLLAIGIALAKLLRAESAPSGYVHATAWTGLVLGVIVAVIMRRKSQHL